MAAERSNAEAKAVLVAEPGVYRECMRNHGLNFGRYTVDGCCEFLQLNDDAFHCAACGCHRSFHRKEPSNQHHVTPPPRPPNHSPSPLASHSKRGTACDQGTSLKRTRTKLTAEQKKEMMRFTTEKLGWRPQRHNEGEIERFCGELGISQRVLTVWFYNNKSKLVGKKV
ncbi:hypothetical protein SLEP1_g40856 [Rubroshorea leprosula]|uniref:Uncharacterized protein n=1 Tax=Rubroshorea leprosula TaxID=152421 RepID=A0AAV5L533_9ROSI|nr:hypothetical protein SLEP1_g40856 [Rubroshorea leprosula]